MRMCKRMQLTNGGNMSRQTLLRCLISMYIISAAAMKTTTVKSCSELIAVLGTKDHANRIIVQGHLQCEREKDTDSVEIRKSIIIEGSDTSEIAPSIDWADTRALLVATGSVTITFRNLIFIQDSPGMTGISLSFLSAEKGASAVFEDIGVGLRRCTRPIGDFDETFVRLPRPKSAKGKQRAVKVGDDSLGILDVAYTPPSSESEWRICNGLFKCDVQSPDDPVLSGFLAEFRGVRCSEPTFFKQVVGLLVSTNMDTKTSDNKSFLGFEWTMVLLGVLLAVLIVLTYVGYRKFILPRCKPKIKQGTEMNKSTDAMSRLEELPMANIEHNMELSSIELGDLIGRGPFGIVYKGSHHGLLLAVKAIDHEEINNMSEINEYLEAYVHAQMHHNNVVRTFLFQTLMMDDLYKLLISSWALRSADLAEGTLSSRVDDGENSFKARYNSYRTFMVMEYCDLGPLSLALQNGAFHSYRPRFKVLILDVLHTALEIAQGMKHLHSMRLIHGDLKPSNILLRRNRAHWRGFESKVADYGMSPFCNNKAMLESAPLEVVVHIAPEQLDHGVLSQTGDVYSFGLLLWQMIACESPLTHMREDMTVSDIIAGERPRIPDFFPEPCSRLIQECWQEHHQLRPSFTLVVDRLKGAIAGITQEGLEQVEISIGPSNSSTVGIALSAENEDGLVDRYETEELQGSLDQLHLRSKSLGQDEPFLETDCNLLPPVPGLDLTNSGLFDEDSRKLSGRNAFASARGNEAV